MMNRIFRSVLLKNVAILAALTTPALAADLEPHSPISSPIVEKAPKGSFFIEGLGGVGIGVFSDLDFINPVGTAFTTNATAGNQILLADIDNTDVSFSLKAAIGYKFENNVFVRGSYSYFDELQTSGFANFTAGNFEQELSVSAHVVLGEIGYHLPVNEQFFLEGSVGLGAAFTESDGLQGANLGEDNFFPENDGTNFAVNVGATAGYKFTPTISGLLSVDYTFVGDVETGVTDGTESAVGIGINPGEQLQSDLNLFRVMAGLRVSF